MRALNNLQRGDTFRYESNPTTYNGNVISENWLQVLDSFDGYEQGDIVTVCSNPTYKPLEDFVGQKFKIESFLTDRKIAIKFNDQLIIVNSSNFLKPQQEVLTSFYGYKIGDKLTVDPNTEVTCLGPYAGQKVTIKKFVNLPSSPPMVKLEELGSNRNFFAKRFVKNNYSTDSKESKSISYDLSRITDTKPGSERHSSGYERSRTKPSFSEWNAPQQSKGYSCSRRKAAFSTI